jgi:hypothetical protein
MVEIVKFEEAVWVPNSNNKMLHKDKKGRWFLGSPNHENKTVIGVVTGPDEKGNYHIHGDIIQNK